MKYAEENSMITVGCFNEQEKIRITISNIIRKDIDPDPLMISQGFYHAKPLHGEGFGLGLWIADTLAGFLGALLSFRMNEKRFEVEISISHLEIRAKKDLRENL